MAQKAGSLDILASTTLLTHTLTHTGKGAGGINGHDSAAYHCLMEQIGPEKTKKQTMNGSQSVGKDEVGSSNLPSSSTRNLGTNVPGFFVCLEKMQRTGPSARCAVVDIMEL